MKHELVQAIEESFRNINNWELTSSIGNCTFYTEKLKGVRLTVGFGMFGQYNYILEGVHLDKNLGDVFMKALYEYNSKIAESEVAAKVGVLEQIFLDGGEL